MKSIIIYILTLTAIIILSFSAHARSAKSGKAMLTRLSELDTLMSISQDLEENTQVYISVTKETESSCYCVCRYPSWVCTNADSCKMHNNECSNLEEKKKDS